MDYKKVVRLIDTFYKENVGEDYFINNIDNIKSYDISDIMCHPAFLDDFILNSTSYTTYRTKEHKILTSNEVKQFLEENNIEITNYRHI